MFEVRAYPDDVVAAWQGSLLDGGPDVRTGRLGRFVQRVPLSRGAWLDLRPRWVDGADTLFERLLDVVPWRAERRPMYDRVVDVPRLLCFYDEDEPLPDPALNEAKRALDSHYAQELGEPFRTAGLCLYRDGRDSVAWHGDYVARRMNEAIVATISVGGARRFLLRPKGGGRSISFDLGHGDLLVMGGTCQRTWQHAIPKVAHADPRIAIMFRPAWKKEHGS